MSRPVAAPGALTRLWVVLGALAESESATLVQLVAATGYPKATVADQLKKLLRGEVPCVEITKVGAVYRLARFDDLKAASVSLYRQRHTEESQ